jgi:hypothetical protein
LTLAAQEWRKVLDVGSRQVRRLQLGGFSIPRQQFGIWLIDFGQQIEGFGEFSHMTRVDQGNWDLASPQLGQQSRF